MRKFRGARADAPTESGRHRRLPLRDARGRFRRRFRGETTDLVPPPEPGVGRHAAIDRLLDHPESLDRERPPGRHAGDRIYRWGRYEIRDDLPRTHPNPAGSVDSRDGRRNLGPLESVVYRQWDVYGTPSPEVVGAIDSLASLPADIQQRLADGLDGIYVGRGGVPELDEMDYLRGQALPNGWATWDICAGAYGDRKIIVGDRPSPAPDVMMHEVGHALDDIDGGVGGWQSDEDDFRELYQQCLPFLSADFHRQPGPLGRREFFADAFSAIASRQRPALVDMLGGNTRAALNVMLYYNRRYGI